MSAYYNEIDPFAAAWLRELIKQGHIAPGEVDTRSIEDVRPSDLVGFSQCHFFAGIGVWSHALRRAGWPDDHQVWTGSCPCQPFSAAGKGAGFADERHLWPSFHHLIGQCRPRVVLGEQVASKDGLAWLDLVAADMEREDYSFGAVDTCAAGFGAPHIRQRLYWVADTCGSRAWWDAGAAFSEEAGVQGPGHSDGGFGGDASLTGRAARGLAHPGAPGLPLCECQDLRGEGRREEGRAAQQRGGASGGVGGTPSFGLEGRESLPRQGAGNLDAGASAACRPRPVNGHWRDADWLLCRDGKWRPVEPSTFPLVNGAANRVGRLRGYGNAIVAAQAEAFVEAYLEVTGARHE